VVVVLGMLITTTYVLGAYRLGRGLRGILVSTKYFLMGGSLILAGYSGYQVLNMLTLYAAAGDPVVMLRYTALAVGGYAGIASFGYVMSRFFKMYRGSFTRFKAGLIQKVEQTDTQQPAPTVSQAVGEPKN